MLCSSKIKESILPVFIDEAGFLGEIFRFREIILIIQWVNFSTKYSIFLGLSLPLIRIEIKVLFFKIFYKRLSQIWGKTESRNGMPTGAMVENFGIFAKLYPYEVQWMSEKSSNE